MDNYNFSDKSFDLNNITQHKLELLLATAKEEIIRFIRCEQAMKRIENEINVIENKCRYEQKKPTFANFFFPFVFFVIVLSLMIIEHNKKDYSLENLSQTLLFCSLVTKNK